MSPALATLLALSALAATPEPLERDALLASLVNEALTARPELAAARARIEAESERVPQASAFSDPMVTLGIQNDGFTAIRIGEMQTSYVSLMASQTFPWWGKRALREGVAQRGVEVARTELDRAALTVRAEVERAYVDLLLVRDELKLLGKLDALWLQSSGLARVRYEAGEGAQSDLLRAQLERSRLAQRRFGLAAEERRRLAVLNRLRGRQLAEPLETTRSLADVADPPAIDVAAETRDAEAKSPELARATAGVAQARARADLARREAFPDVTVGAGIMVRGALEPMWLASVGVNLPVFSSGRQARAAAEAEAQARAGEGDRETVARLLRQRIEERAVVLEGMREANALYRNGLLVQSEATVASTLAQYQTGRVTFAAVLEALAGYVNDFDGFLSAVATVQRVAIAQRELSLEPVTGPELGGGGAAMPGASSSMGASPASGSGMREAAPAASSGRSSSGM